MSEIDRIVVIHDYSHAEGGAGMLAMGAIRGYRERGPVTPTHFLIRPALIITGHAELLDGFKDIERFPPHRMYQASL